MKRFLLLAGAGYYPSGGTGDWIIDSDSRHELESEIKTVGKFGCIYKNKEYDWYEIVDLDKHSLSEVD